MSHLASDGAEPASEHELERLARCGEVLHLHLQVLGLVRALPHVGVLVLLLPTSTSDPRAAYYALIDELDKLPGDGRTQVGFITFHRTLQI